MTYLKFEDPTNWFAWTYLVMGRPIDENNINGANEAVAKEMCGQIRDFYNGDWKKS